MNRSKRLGTLASTASCLLIVCLCAPAFPAQTKNPAHQKPDWNDKILPGSPLTVLELTRKIIPDIKTDPGKAEKVTASDLSGVRLLDGVEETGMELDPDAGAECEITDQDYILMKDGDDTFLVLFLGVDGTKVVTGLFKISPEVTLLDAVTIAQDMHADVEPEKVWTIHPRHQAFVVHCWHDNSSESFDQYTFISIVDRKLRAVADLGGFEGFVTYMPARQRLCKTAISPKFQFVQSSSPGYLDLIVNAMALKACHRDSEEWSWKTGVVYQKSVRQLWRWDARKKQYRKASTGRRR